MTSHSEYDTSGSALYNETPTLEAMSTSAPTRNPRNKMLVGILVLGSLFLVASLGLLGGGVGVALVPSTNQVNKAANSDFTGEVSRSDHLKKHQHQRKLPASANGGVSLFGTPRSGQPSSDPSLPPSPPPSSTPSDSPSVAPSSSLPSSNPSGQPSSNPSLSPSSLPSGVPSSSPSSSFPSGSPSGTPSSSPSATPSVTSERPSGTPTNVPSSEPSAPIGYEHVISRVDSQECPLINATIPLTLNAVTTRELVLGCHAFEEYLSPNFETIFILNEELARTWGIDTLVRDATCDQTLGAHLFLLDNYGGEWLGRRVAVDFILREMNVRRGSVQFLNQMNCDVRALPKDHVHYRSIGQTVEKLAKDLSVARAQREPESYPDIEFPSFPLVTTQSARSRWVRYGILAMAPVLFEDFFDMDELPTRVHGVDICRWAERGGLAGRPGNFGDYPWLCDTHRFAENHWLIFDVEKLTSPAVKAQYLDSTEVAHIDGYPSDTRLTPRVAAQHELTTVLNFDVHGHQNFCHPSDSMDHYPEHIDRDWIRVTSWVHLAEQRNPATYYEAWNGINDLMINDPFLGLTMMGFTNRHCYSESPWFPVGLFGSEKSLDSCDLCSKFVFALLKSLGYDYFDEDDDNMYFHLVGVFPLNIYVNVDTSNEEAPNDSWEFLQVATADGQKLRYIALGSFETSDMRSLSPTERILPVPKKGWIDGLQQPSEIKRMRYIHIRGRYWPNKAQVCGPPDQDPDQACGFLEGTNFDE